MFVDCHTHPLGHEGGKYSIEKLRPFVEQGLAQGLKGIGFTDHEWYRDSLDIKAVEELQKEYPELIILMGIEVDYVPGREKEISTFLSEKPYDYAIGSVHNIDDWPFDHPLHKHKYEEININFLYERYFALMEEMVCSGLFQIVGHLDLVKIFGYRYHGDLLTLVEPLLQKVKDKSMAIELNTNGRYKPIKEFYPSVEILSSCIRYQIPLCLSSDAHEAKQVGRDFDLGKKLLKDLGCRQAVHFFRNKMVFTDF